MGRTIEDALSGRNILTKLSAYETRLLRQAERLLAQLRQLRASRDDFHPEGHETQLALDTHSGGSTTERNGSSN